MAFWVAIADSAISVVLLVVRWATTDLHDYVTSRVHSFVHNGHTVEVTPAIVIGTIVLTIAIVLIGAAVHVIVALAFLRGSGWARIVVSLLAAVWLVGMVGELGGMVAAVGAVQTVITDVATVVVAASVVLLWLPDANRYFRDVTADRKHFRATSFPVKRA